MAEPIVFYDIPGKVKNQAWSPNTWKTRYALNYKGVPYTTKWVEYPDIKKVSEEIGAAPTSIGKDGTPNYTLPIIYDPSTKAVVSDSFAIAEYLDKTYPSLPRLLPEGTHALQAAFNQAFSSAVPTQLRWILLPATNFQLNPRSEEYFRRTREASFGQRMEELSPPGPKREEHWKNIKEAYGQVASWLAHNGEGKLFVMEDVISYADFIIGGWTIWIKMVIGEDSPEWADLQTWDGGRWAKFMKALEKYEAVDAGQ